MDIKFEDLQKAFEEELSKTHGNVSIWMYEGRNFDYNLGINYVVNSGVACDEDTYDSVEQMVEMEIASLECGRMWVEEDDESWLATYDALENFFKAFLKKYKEEQQ